MGALKTALILFQLLSAAPIGAAPIDRWASEVKEASLRFDVPEAWIWRVLQAESGGRTHLGGRLIESPAGAMGLMQLMPTTWAELRALLGLGSNPHNPRDNILASTFYLRMMYDRFGYPGLFAAYNAGPTRYAAHVVGSRPLPAETIAYVADVAGAGALATPAEPPHAVELQSTLFALRAHAPTEDDAVRHPAQWVSSEGLFVVLEHGAPR